MTELMNIKIIKKDNRLEDFDAKKIINAVSKSAERVLIDLKEQDFDILVKDIVDIIKSKNISKINITQMHNIVETALEKNFKDVAKSYKDYRNYKKDFVLMLDNVYKKSQSIMYFGDKENSNLDSSLVSTKRSLIFNELNKELYKKFFLNKKESLTDMWSATLQCYIKLSTLKYKLRVFCFKYFLDTFGKLFYNQTFFLGCCLLFIQDFLFYLHLLNWSQFLFISSSNYPIYVLVWPSLEWRIRLAIINFKVELFCSYSHHLKL
ncbi:ATP cone domain-containing protein [Malacoplasma iowae]|uniref:ATP cone domain-containing protein n=1 Tax=Malacoplasma iowae TaxID=2116 RepID=UPI003873645C|nr:ATP cone domain-containing protein [Malacoplasma iowae]